MFKVGDKVECVNTCQDSYAEVQILKGDICEVLDVYNSQLNSCATCLDLRLPNGEVSNLGWYAHWFKPVASNEPAAPEPSKEALEMAKGLCPYGWQVASVAAALQKLMDERDRNHRMYETASQELRIVDELRAAAEARLLDQKALAEANVALKQRAEAAEKALENAEIDKTNARWQEAEERAEAAEKARDGFKERLKAMTKLHTEEVERRSAAENWPLVQQWIQRTNEANARADAAEKDRDAYRRGQEDLNTAMLGYIGERDRAQAQLQELIRRVRRAYPELPRIRDVLEEYESPNADTGSDDMDQREKSLRRRQDDEGAAWTQTMLDQKPAKVFADGAEYGRRDARKDVAKRLREICANGCMGLLPFIEELEK